MPCEGSAKAELAPERESAAPLLKGRHAVDQRADSAAASANILLMSPDVTGPSLR